MLSVENFYWTLYENLLRPSGLDCWYYYPFGTMQNLSRSEFGTLTEKSHYAFFHFDQEPLYNNDFGLYDSVCTFYPFTGKVLKLLANSERSQIKKHVCQSRNMLDWYFFYHGFASLDWFRDSKYIAEPTEITNTFLSVNHLINDHRSYRMTLTAKLIEMEILSKGVVSFHGTVHDCIRELESPHSRLSAKSRDQISRYLCTANHLPIRIDQTKIDGSASAHFGPNEHALWQRSFLHVVNETVFYDPKLHLTEKTFKPIVSLRPFVLVSAPGNLAYLRSYGFKTFSNWIDETYDKIAEPDLRLNLIAEEIYKISRLSLKDLKNLYNDMLPTLQFNKNHFFNEFRHTITSELVDNFDTCIRLWNHARVDGRLVPQVSDPETVKRMLLL
jgi:hypothetical protein